MEIHILIGLYMCMHTDKKIKGFEYHLHFNFTHHTAHSFAVVHCSGTITTGFVQMLFIYLFSCWGLIFDLFNYMVIVFAHYLNFEIICCLAFLQKLINSSWILIQQSFQQIIQSWHNDRIFFHTINQLNEHPTLKA